MGVQEIILQDQNLTLHRLKKVKDTIFDPVKKIETIQWLWVYSETSIFFNIELWSALDHAYLNQKIGNKKNIFKVIEVNLDKKIKYS